MTAKIVELTKCNLLDIPNMLRNLADEIEEGKYGGVLRVAAAMETDSGFETFGFGPNCDAPNTYYLLHTAANKLLP